MSYTEYIKNQITNYGPGEPIYIKTLSESLENEFHLTKKEAAAATSVAVKRLMDRTEIPDLRFFQKGIYYKTECTPFGETGISRHLLIRDKYLINDSGYESGLNFLHHIGLTTQIPRDEYYVTNKATGGIREDKSLGIFICPPKMHIDTSNKHYLQVLDVIHSMFKAPIDVAEPYRLVALYIQKLNLDYKILLSFANRYYNRNTILTLAGIAGECV